MIGRRSRKPQFDCLESRACLSALAVACTIGNALDHIEKTPDLIHNESTLYVKLASMVLVGKPQPKYIVPVMWTPPFAGPPYMPYYAGNVAKPVTVLWKG